MKHVLYFIILFFIPKAFAQVWGANTQSDFTNEATCMAFDSQDNLYVAGYITGQTGFSTSSSFPSAAGNGDIFVAKYNPSGSLIWVKKFGGNMSDRAFKIKVDNAQNVLVTGQYFGTVQFGSYSLQSVNNSKDIFLTKLDPQGEVLWAISEGGPLGDNVYGLAIDQNNHVLLTGQFSGNASIAGQNFSSVVNPTLNQPSYDIFLSKYNAGGTPLWALHGEAEYEDRGMALETDNQNNIYLAGQFSDTLSFGGQVFNNGGYNVGFITKLNSAGQIQWFNKMYGGLVVPYDLAIGEDNTLSICGDYLGTFAYHDGTLLTSMVNSFDKKVFVTTINREDGTLQWQRSLGSDSEISARGIDRKGNQIYVAGHFRCALTELQQSNTALYNSVGFRDIYLWSLNASGNSLQTKQMGGRKNDYAYGIEIGSNNRPYVCGSYMENLYAPIFLGSTLLPNSNYAANSYSGGYYRFFGDESANALVSNVLSANSFDYNYFNQNTSDSLFGFISTNDTVTLCASGTIGYNPQTHTVVGPEYTYLWNTGDTTKHIFVNQPGTYSVNVSRADGCVSYTDSAVVFIQPIPIMPFLSDDFIQYTDFNLNLDNAEYQYCPPDSFNIWFNNLAPTLDITIQGNGIVYNDTLPHQYPYAGTYYVIVSDSLCSNQKQIIITHDEIFDKEIEPLAQFTDPDIFNDTLTVCMYENSTIHVIDLLTNPQQDFSIGPDVNIVNQDFNLICNGTPVTVADTNYYATFQILQTGWYILNYNLITGYDNTCGVDTLLTMSVDSIYIVAHPVPQFQTTITANSLLCPNDSVTLNLSNTYPTFSWSGPGITYIAPDNSYIYANSAGSYYYSGVVTDSITGCTKNYSFLYNLHEKVPPVITTDPLDGVVCPYDSVLLSVPNTYVSYEWFGPSGSNLSNTNTHLDAELGFYYCTVIDQDGCALTTLPAELKEFSTPYIAVYPENVICPGETAELTAISVGNVDLVWSAPLSGTSMVQNVSQPGWYSVEMTACGITIVDSVLVIDGSFSVQISAADTLLCENEIETITGNVLDGFYEWTNGTSGSNILMTGQAGTYAATVTNAFGCQAQSDTVELFLFDNPAPNSYDLQICTPQDLVLNTGTNVPALWFDENYNPLDTAVMYTALFDTSTVIYVAFPQDVCPLNYGEINIEYYAPIVPGYSISGDSILCYNDFGSYSLDWSGDVQWILNDSLVSTDSIIFLNGQELLNLNNLTAVISNVCYSDSLFFEISVFQQNQLIPSFYDTSVCVYTELMLDFNPNYQVYDLSTGFLVDDPYIFDSGLNSGQYDFWGLDTNGCPTDTVTVNINVFEQVPLEIIELNLPYCVPDTLLLTSNLVGENVTWLMDQMQVVQDTFAFELQNSGWYLVEAFYTDANGCSQLVGMNFDVYEPSAISLPDSMICIGEMFFTSFYFDPLNSPALVPLDTVIITQSQEFVITVNNDVGCPFTDTVYIEALDCLSPPPNVITPNGDGTNEFFVIKTAPIEPNNSLIILNRWGQVVYEKESYQNDFSGADLPDGVYFYKYIRDRYSPNNEPVLGNLHVIRGK